MINKKKNNLQTSTMNPSGHLKLIDFEKLSKTSRNKLTGANLTTNSIFPEKKKKPMAEKTPTKPKKPEGVTLK